MKIIEDHNMLEQRLFKFPRKKKNQRWMKKYKKKYSIKVPREDFLYCKEDDIVICHPIMAGALKHELQGII